MAKESFDIEINLDMTQATAEFTKYMTALNSMLTVARRMGLSEDFQQQIQQIQKLITTIYLARAAYISLMAVRAASGDPLAWMGVIVTGAGAISSLVDLGGY